MEPEPDAKISSLFISCTTNYAVTHNRLENLPRCPCCGCDVFDHSGPQPICLGCRAGAGTAGCCEGLSNADAAGGCGDK